MIRSLLNSNTDFNSNTQRFSLYYVSNLFLQYTSGIIVDLFSDGKVLSQLEEV